MGRANVDAYDWLTRFNRAGAVSQHHREHIELADGLLGELGEGRGQVFLPRIELEPFDGYSVVLPPGQSDEGDHTAAAIHIEYLAQSLWVESLGLDEHPYASHAVPSGCCA